jgi:hypothetical protein
VSSSPHVTILPTGFSVTRFTPTRSLGSFPRAYPVNRSATAYV